MFHYHIPISFCAYAISHDDVQPIKFLPSLKLNNESPYYILYRKTFMIYLISRSLDLYALLLIERNFRLELKSVFSLAIKM